MDYEDKIDKLIKKNQIIDESSIPISLDKPIETDEEKKKDYEDLKRTIKDSIEDSNKDTVSPIRKVKPIGFNKNDVLSVGERNKRTGFFGGLKSMFSSRDTSISPMISPISTPTTMTTNELEAKKKEKGGKYFKEPFIVEGKEGKKYDLTDVDNKKGYIIKLEDKGLITEEEARRARIKL